MLDDRQDSRCDEPRGTDDTARAGQLANLYCRTRRAYFDGAAGPGRFDCVLAGSPCTGVHENFNKIAFSHASVYAQIGSF
jgi:hypothetical protein